MAQIIRNTRTASIFKSTARVLAAAVNLALVASAEAKEPSVCKGLEQAPCSANAACKWQPATVAGETSASSGKAYKKSRKAYCRLAPLKKAG